MNFSGGSSAKQHVRFTRWNSRDQPRGVLTEHERARIADLQDLLIERFVEHRKAVADGQDERVKTVEAEIDSFLREKKEIEKWAVAGSA